MWSWLASLIGGPVITGLINAYKARLDAANTQDRIAADLASKEIEAEIEARKQASAIIIAEQGRWSGGHDMAAPPKAAMNARRLIRSRRRRRLAAMAERRGQAPLRP